MEILNAAQFLLVSNSRFRFYSAIVASEKQGRCEIHHK